MLFLAGPHGTPVGGRYINIYTVGHSKLSAHRDVPVCPACSFSVDAVLIFKFLLFACGPREY